jgi:hypothetical protein
MAKFIIYNLGAAASPPLRYGFAVAHTFAAFRRFGTATRTIGALRQPFASLALGAPMVRRAASPRVSPLRGSCRLIFDLLIIGQTHRSAPTLYVKCRGGPMCPPFY